MKILKKNSINYELAGKELKNGKIVVFPTDTVYGIGANYKDKKAIDKIYKYKNRDRNKPLILLISKKEYLDKIAIFDKEKVEKIIKKFWPGALTLVLNKNMDECSKLNTDFTSVGVRIPNNKAALEIIENAGGIIASTSANISDKETPTNYNELDKEFIGKVDYVIKEEKTHIGIASTIIDMTGNKIKILREGIIKKGDILD